MHWGGGVDSLPGNPSRQDQLITLRIAALSLLLLGALGCAGSSAPKPRWVEAPDSNLAAAETFGWLDRSGEPPVTILDNQIRDAIRADLVKKGYVEASETPDFVVGHETFESAAVQQGNPVRIGIGVGSWGGSGGGSVGTSMDVGDGEKVVQQITVTIRAVDPDDDREVWIGTTAPMSEQPDTPTVTRTVGGVMKGFPGRND